MAEEENGSESKKICFNEDWYSLVSSGEPDPENGRAGGDELLQKASEAGFAKYINMVVNCLLGNIQDKHLPSVKLLMDLEVHLASKNATPADFESFAKVIHKAFLKELAELEELEKAEAEEARKTIDGEWTSLNVEPCGE
jgi:hypothetical protein